MTRALAELLRLGTAMGGKPQTFYGLSGAGDLIATCFSQHSRNRRVGEQIGRGRTVEQITASTQTVAEGIPTTKSAFECARRLEHRDADHRPGLRGALRGQAAVAGAAGVVRPRSESRAILALSRARAIAARSLPDTARARRSGCARGAIPAVSLGKIGTSRCAMISPLSITGIDVMNGAASHRFAGG